MRFASRAGSLPFLLLALAASGLPAEAAAQGLDLSGAWVLTVTSPNGTGERQVIFVQDGHDLTGQISSSRATGALTGSVEGDKVTFLAVVEMESGAFEIVYEATVADGEMKGTVDFGDYGTGTFTGRRANSQE